MSDEIDRAQAREEEIRQEALAARERQRAALPQHSARVCTGCDAPIPEARRLAVRGCQRCVDCQNDAELRARQNRN